MTRQIKLEKSWKSGNRASAHGKGLLSTIISAAISRHAPSTLGFPLSTASGKFDDSEVSSHNASVTTAQALLRRVGMLQ